MEVDENNIKELKNRIATLQRLVNDEVLLINLQLQSMCKECQENGK